jgi:hypothetical protein
MKGLVKPVSALYKARFLEQTSGATPAFGAGDGAERPDRAAAPAQQEKLRWLSPRAK